jgi:hypothetical protein
MDYENGEHESSCVCEVWLGGPTPHHLNVVFVTQIVKYDPAGDKVFVLEKQKIGLYAKRSLK